MNSEHLSFKKMKLDIFEYQVNEFRLVIGLIGCTSSSFFGSFLIFRRKIGSISSSSQRNYTGDLKKLPKAQK